MDFEQRVKSPTRWAIGIAGIRETECAALWGLQLRIYVRRWCLVLRPSRYRSLSGGTTRACEHRCHTASYRNGRYSEHGIVGPHTFLLYTISFVVDLDGHLPVRTCFVLEMKLHLEEESGES